MVKEIKHGNKGIHSLLEGIEKTFKVVSATMGARGQNILFRKGRRVITTKDGVTVALEVFLEDAFEDIGAQMVKEACAETNNIAGDGTTATCVLLRSLVKHAIKYLLAGANPLELVAGMKNAVQDILTYIDASSVPVSDKSDIKNIAKISLNGDEKIAELISEAMQAVGKNGVVTCRETSATEDKLEIIEGMQFAQGAIFPHFLDLNGEASIDNPLIIFHEGMIRVWSQIESVANKALKENRPLVIFTHECNVDVCRSLIENKMKGVLQSCVVRTPGTGRQRDEILKDIAVYTGGKVFSEFGGTLKKATIDDLGQAKKIVVTQYKTTLYEGAGSTEAIDERCELIKVEMDSSDDNGYKELLSQRIARLKTGIGVILVGGETEIEIQEKKFRVNDALQAVRASLKDGIVAGGGVALLEASSACNDHHKATGSDLSLGYQLVLNAIKEPFRTIVQNAGFNSDMMLDQFKEKKEFGTGFDVITGLWTNFFKEGIIDPTLVITTSLKKALATALQVIFTKAVLVEKTVEKK